VSRGIGQLRGSTSIDNDAFTAFEEGGWDAKAAGYDDFVGRVTSRLVEPLLDAVDARSGVRLLDVASGPGYAAVEGARRGASVVGVDISEAMVELASRLHPQVEFRVGNAEDLPFPDSSFDAVVGNFVTLHLARPEKAAAEFYRVLSPRGRVALTVWDVPERTRLFGVFLDATAEAGAVPPDEIPDGPPFFRFSNDDEFVRLLQEQSFDNVDVETIAFSCEVPSASALWQGLLAGTVRTSALIERQSEDVQRQIYAAFMRAVEPYDVGGRLELPVAVKLASGNKSRAAVRRDATPE
jgi:ubiquinone/menaquinone biosynthesis C-methylase UbiE